MTQAKQGAPAPEIEKQKDHLFTKIVEGGRAVVREVHDMHHFGVAQAMDKKDFLLGLAREAKTALEIRSAEAVSKQAAIAALTALIKVLDEQAETYHSTAQAVHDLRSVEMIVKTGSGDGLLQATQKAVTHTQEARRRVAEAREIIALYDAVQADGDTLVEDEGLNLRLARFFTTNLAFAEQFGRRADSLLALALEVIRFEAVKAWVNENPDLAHKSLEATLVVFDNGIANTARVGDALSNVPDYHTQAAATGIKWGMVAAAAGKAVVDRMLLSADADRQVAKFNKASGADRVFAEHDRDSLLIAKMLRDKAEAEIELILALVEPVVTVSIEWIPYAPVGGIWDALKEIILGAVKQYQQERLDLAEGKGKEGFEIFERFHLDLLATMKDKIKGDVLGAADVVNWTTEAVRETLVNDILKMIMGALPVDPAQRVDGARLRQMMNGIVAAAQVRRSVRVVAPGSAPERPRPQVDGLGRKLTLLSGPIDSPEGRFYFTRRRGVVGRLYEDGTRFVPVDEDDPTTAQYREALKEDSRGIRLSEINMASGRPSPSGEGALLHRARIGDIVGEIDSATAEFTSTGPDPECLDEAAWRLRAIDVPAGGYWNVIDGHHDGPIVEGTWYRPWPDTRAHVFAFVPKSQNSRREFAIGLWRTATPDRNIEDSVAAVAVDRDVVSP